MSSTSSEEASITPNTPSQTAAAKLSRVAASQAARPAQSVATTPLVNAIARPGAASQIAIASKVSAPRGVRKSICGVWPIRVRSMPSR